MLCSLISINSSSLGNCVLTVNVSFIQFLPPLAFGNHHSMLY